jgi:hypothetical protein
METLLIASSLVNLALDPSGQLVAAPTSQYFGFATVALKLVLFAAVASH